MPLLSLVFVDINSTTSALRVGMIIRVLYVDTNKHQPKSIIVMTAIKLKNFGCASHVVIWDVETTTQCLVIFINIFKILVMLFVNQCLIIKTKILSCLIKPLEAS